MLDAAREAIEFGGELTVKELEADRVRSLAPTRCVEIIGEAAAAVSPDFRAEHSDIPWRIIVATPNRLAHAYFDIDLSVLVDTVAHDLPVLVAQLECIAVEESA